MGKEQYQSLVNGKLTPTPIPWMFYIDTGEEYPNILIAHPNQSFPPGNVISDEEGKPVGTVIRVLPDNSMELVMSDELKKVFDERIRAAFYSTGEDDTVCACGTYLPGIEIISKDEKQYILRNRVPDEIRLTDGSPILNNIGDVVAMVVRIREDGLIVANRSEYIQPRFEKLMKLIERAKETGEVIKEDGMVAYP